MKLTVDEQCPWRVPIQQPLQRFGIRPARGSRNLQQADAPQPELLEQIRITGTFHHDTITGLEQDPDNQIKPLGSACGRQHLLLLDSDCLLLQMLDDLLAQGWQAMGGAVIEQSSHVGAGHLANGITEVIALPPAFGHTTAPERQAVQGALTCRTTACETQPGSVTVGHGPRRRDKKCRTLTRGEHALGNHALIRLNNTGLAEQVIPGQLPDRRQTRSRLDATLANPAHEGVNDLLHHRHQRLAIDSQLHEKTTPTV
ncbi:hypothetical protein D3C78_1180330 [compost metagenome]